MSTDFDLIVLDFVQNLPLERRVGIYIFRSSEGVPRLALLDQPETFGVL